MIQSPNLTAILDANVLYPAPLRDFLLNLADINLFEPKWTEEIHDEWINNLLLKRTDLRKNSLIKTERAMDSAFPDAIIKGYEQFIRTLSLPDTNDRHILAAAISANADVIITFNLKHFPSAYLKSFNLKAMHPDEFINELIMFNRQNCLKALDNQISNLKNSPKSKEEVLTALMNCGLKNSILNLKK